MYKVALVLLGLLAAHSTANKYEDRVRELLEQLRDRMCKPIEYLGLPQLHPLTIKEFPFDLDMEMAHLKGELRDVTIAELGRFRLGEDLKITILPPVITASITFPVIDISGKLKVKGDVGGIPLNGPGGPFSIHVENLYIGFTDKFSGKHNIAELKITVDQFETVVNGLTEDEEIDKFFGKLISQLVPDYLNHIWTDETEAAAVRAMVSEKLNELTGGMQLSEILAILTGEVELFEPIEEEDKCKY